MGLTNCPKCGRPVGGRARVCGYCGESLVREYFRRPTSGNGQPILVANKCGYILGLIVCLLGASGAVLLLSAEVFHLLALYGFGPEPLRPSMESTWWLRAVMLLIPTAVYLGRRAAFGRRGGSLIGEGLWLMLAGAGLTACFLFYWDRGLEWFYGLYQIPYLVTAGCGLILVAQLAAIGNTSYIWKRKIP